MRINRVSGIVAAVAVLMLALTAVTVTARVTNAGGGDGDDDATEQQVAPGTLDDGEEFLSRATITLDQAIAAAQGAASGSIGEVDLEEYHGRLAFNVDVGDSDVKIDAATGEVLGIGED